MALPSKLWRVTWHAARHPDRPLDRSEQSRNYATAEAAGDQCEAIARISPSHADLVGVWLCTGGSGALVWEPVDPSTLPVSDRAQALTRTLRRHSPPFAKLIQGEEYTSDD